MAFIKEHEQTIFWLLLALVSVVSYGGYLYWFRVTAPQASPSLILNLPT